MKTLINVISALLVLTIVIVAFGLTTSGLTLIVVSALLVALIMIRLSNSTLSFVTLVEGPTSVEFMAQADVIGFELFLEYIEEEDFDISGDFEDGVIICWISNPEGTPLTTMQLEGLLEMQKFLCQWA